MHSLSSKPFTLVAHFSLGSEQCPLLLRHVTRKAVIPQGLGLPNIDVQKGDLILADLHEVGAGCLSMPITSVAKYIASQAMTVAFTGSTSDQISSDLYIYGMGLHKCPGMTLADQVSFSRYCKATYCF